MLPEVNDSPFRRTLFEHGGWREIQRALLENGITPQTHPYGGDFFAGGCGGAYALEQSGWPVENIVCFDDPHIRLW